MGVALLWIFDPYRGWIWFPYPYLPAYPSYEYCWAPSYTPQQYPPYFAYAPPVEYCQFDGAQMTWDDRFRAWYCPAHRGWVLR